MRMMQVLAYVIRIPVQYHSVFSLFTPNVLQHCKLVRIFAPSMSHSGGTTP